MTENDKQPKRRWLRFSLRSFLIVVTLFGVIVGPFVYRAEKQRAAVKWVLENGGSVDYDFETDENSQPPRWLYEWLYDMHGFDYFYTVTSVYHVGTHVSDVTPLAGLKNLELLFLSETQVNDLTPLSGLMNLEFLRLENTQVSDVTPLSGLTNLSCLRLSKTQVNDVTPLASLTNLEKLYLDGTQVSDVTPLAGLTKLMNLDIRDTPVSDEDYEKLKQALPNRYIQYASLPVVTWPQSETIKETTTKPVLEPIEIARTKAEPETNPVPSSPPAETMKTALDNSMWRVGNHRFRFKADGALGGNGDRFKRSYWEVTGDNSIALIDKKGEVTYLRITFHKGYRRGDAAWRDGTKRTAYRVDAAKPASRR